MIDLTEYGFEVAARAPQTEALNAGAVATKAYEAIQEKIQGLADKHVPDDETIPTFGFGHSHNGLSMNLEFAGHRLHIFVAAPDSAHLRRSGIKDITDSVKILVTGNEAHAIDVSRGDSVQQIVNQVFIAINAEMKADVDDHLAELNADLRKIQKQIKAVTAVFGGFRA